MRVRRGFSLDGGRSLNLVRYLLKANAILALAVASPAYALAEEPVAETNSIPPLIPSATFADPGYLRHPVISPDGQRLAFRERIDNETYIAIKPIDGDEITRLPIAEKRELNWYRWASPTRLIMSIGLFGSYSRSALVAYDLTTGKTLQLGRPDQGWVGDDVLYIDPQGEFLLLAFERTWAENAGVFRIGIADNSITEVVRPQSNIRDWIADNQGVVRMGLAYRGGNTKVYYRRTYDEEFRLIDKIREDDDDDKTENNLLEVSKIVSGRDEGFVLSNKQTGRFALYRFNYATRDIGELIYGHPENDITGFSLTEDGSALEAVRYTDSRDRVHWFDPAQKKLQAQLDAAMPGQEAWMSSRSRDGSRIVVYLTSPTDPGSYALFEPKKRQLDLFATVNHKLDIDALAQTKYVHYAARDGLSIAAYLTLPVGRNPQKLPLIILPHGGPYGVRDTLDYHTEVQFLANRGYAVFQPNFRGSESYGETFYKRGEGQIGRAMQDDLDDGMDWLVNQGLVDPARVCIVGSSYGGYAALWGVIRNPERYRCAASFAGVTDFKAQLSYSSKFMRNRYAKEWREIVVGEYPFDLDKVSPAKNAHKLTRPVLLTHGDLDGRVPYSQFDKMMDALKKAKKPIESHTYRGEGHGFEDSANEKDWLDRLEAFLAKHNPADMTPKPPELSPTAPLSPASLSATSG